MGHQVPAPNPDILKPEAEIDRVPVHRRKIDSGGVSQTVMAQHHVARLGHQLQGLAKRDAGHAVPQCLSSALTEVSFQNVIGARPYGKVSGVLGPHRTEIYPDERCEVAVEDSA